ncbi:hypothetical protein HPB49_014044 [Dermacentor silvarum]|uniref:Uncharacterized protein n=1 Tax=Dermacentor silvarum TaxID=543639 RepID=A0ACB8D5M1_DERSI|nr:hypothetical protein HPB49_014044 [Dermacentor silvarum]
MEVMALSRLQWIADIRGVFPPEQCGFRTHRSTADCLAAVVGTLEQASRDGHAAFLLLLDVQSAFDSLPHDTIISAVRALGVEGRLLAYVRAFLTDRWSVVRVGRATSSPRSVTCGVPQGSVLSPFLFNLALAPISECVRTSGPSLCVPWSTWTTWRSSSGGPLATMAQMRLQLQAAPDAVGDFLRAIGLRLSAAKSEAIMVHPRAAARRHTGCVVVDGVPLPWRLTVRYLGLTIDHRLTWLPAVKRLRAAMHQVEGAVRALLALALSRVLYALPLCNLRPHLWRRIDGDHRRVLRMCHGLPSASRVAETLAETGAWPVSLTADLRALGHLERLSRAPGAGPMLSYLRELPKSRVVMLIELFDSLLNPFHKIPTFSDDGFIIYESSAICYYLLRKHAPENELYPNCPRARARIDQALATITSTIQPHYFKFLIPRFYKLKKPTAENVEQFEENVVKGFEHVLGDGNYVLGDKLSVADLSLVAHLAFVLEKVLPITRPTEDLHDFLRARGIDEKSRRAMTIELYAIETREPCIFIRMLANHIGIDVKLKALDYDKQEHLSAEYAKRGSIVKRKKLTGDDLRTFEATVLCPLEQLVSDKTFAVGDTLTVADIRLVSIMSCFVPLPVVDKSRFSKLVSYYERVQALVPSFHEVCGWMLEQRSKEWETYE